ncbi:hypothetical protein PFISCL1PPCAC_26299, partial [Pristionchus fissidentatus]
MESVFDTERCPLIKKSIGNTNFSLRMNYNHEDIFSILPNECIDYVFSYFDNKSLGTMEGVSQKCNRFAQQAQKKQVKN